MITREQFQLQVQRLEDTFGDRHFSDQRTHMIWGYVKDFDYQVIIRMVDHFIRSSKQAPLPIDFQNAVKAEERNGFHREVAGAADAMDHEWQGGMSAYLAKTYGSECKTLKQARDMQVELNKMNRLKGN